MAQHPQIFEIEEQPRGDADILIVSCNTEPRGSIEVHSYEEKVAWMTALETVNRLILEQSLNK